MLNIVKKNISKRKIFVIFTTSKQPLISLRPIKRVAGKPKYKNLRVCRALTDDPQDKNKILLGSWLGSYNYLIKWRPRFNACCNNNCGGFVLMWPKASRQGGWMVGLSWLKIMFWEIMINCQIFTQSVTVLLMYIFATIN